MVCRNEQPEVFVMSTKKDDRPHDWNKEQPHHVETGKITTEKYTRERPEKVEWVKEKKNGK